MQFPSLPDVEVRPVLSPILQAHEHLVLKAEFTGSTRLLLLLLEEFFQHCHHTCKCLVMKSTESFEIFWLELLVPQVGHDSASIDLLFLPHPHLCKNSIPDLTLDGLEVSLDSHRGFSSSSLSCYNCPALNW